MVCRRKELLRVNDGTNLAFLYLYASMSPAIGAPRLLP